MLAGFDYGKDPGDWRFYWDMGAEELARNFWELVEDRPPSLPGAWVEDET